VRRGFQILIVRLQTLLTLRTLVALLEVSNPYR
jgi:hypothetical protein